MIDRTLKMNWLQSIKSAPRVPQAIIHGHSVGQNICPRCLAVMRMSVIEHFVLYECPQGHYSCKETCTAQRTQFITNIYKYLSPFRGRWYVRMNRA